MAISDAVSVIQGTAASFQVTMEDEDGNVVDTYLSSAYDLSARVWAGGSQPPWTVNPTPSWFSDGSDGLLDLTFPANATATQVPAVYQVLVTLVPKAGGDPVPAWLGFVEVVAAPGTTTLAAVPYNTYADLLQYWATLGDLRTENNLAGFMDHLVRARQWLDRAILAHDRNNSYFFMTPSGYAPVSGFGGLGPAGTNPWLKSQLDADLLMVTALTVEIVSFRALGTILSAAVGSDHKEGAFERHGREFLSKADELTGSYVAELDVNHDGFPDYWVDCGANSTRW